MPKRKLGDVYNYFILKPDTDKAICKDETCEDTIKVSFETCILKFIQCFGFFSGNHRIFEDTWRQNIQNSTRSYSLLTQSVQIVQDMQSPKGEFS